MRLAKALVVDDSKVVQFKLSKMLQARGLGVHAAGSGKEALEYLTSNTPDVIFMDYMMSDMCGYQTTSIITANPVTAAIPVIMCTGEDTPEARAQAQDTGASGFIVKPVDDHVLDQVLGALQEKAAAPRPAARAIPLPTTPPVAISASNEDVSRFVERSVREVAERVVREAIAAITTAVEQSSQSIAQMTANTAVQELLADWRAEHASTQERIETAAIAAAERAAQLAVQRALEGIEATRRAIEAAARQAMDSAVDAAREVAQERGREAIKDARCIAESLARESQDAAKLAIEHASRDMLQSARTILQDEHRNAAEAAASIAETVSRKVSEQVEAAARQAMDSAVDAAREVAEERGREAIKDARRIAESLARESQDAAKLAIEHASRDMLQSARTILQDEHRNAAEAAASIAETVSRKVSEQVEAAARQAMDSAVDAAREVAEERGREAIKDARRIAESLARESQDAAKLAIEHASRDMLQSARTILQDEHRNAAGAAASIAETVSRKMSEQVTRNAMDADAASEAGARERLHQCAVAAAERVASEILEKALPATTLSNQSGTEHEAQVNPELAALGENERRQATETDQASAPRIEEETASVLSDAPLNAGATGTDRARPLTISAPTQRLLLPWLAGLTILVLYLLARIYVV